MTVRVINGDCREVLRALPAESVHCVVTSPPYFGLRDYGVAGQLGLERSPGDFVHALVGVFAEVRRVLRKDGTAWLNLGDSYAAKNLIGIPWRVAFALQEDRWYLRQDIIWSKPNPMPESVTDRCTKAHEYLFLLSKGERYYYDAAAIAETAVCPDGPGNTRPYRVAGERSGENANLGGSVHRIGARATRNKRSVWEITTQPYTDAHFATFPPALIEPCILAGCPKGGTVLDPFGGAGTTGLVADRLGRDAILIELNPDYAAMVERRICGDAGMFADVIAQASS